MTAIMTKMKPLAQRKQAGVTLIELLMTIGVVAILVALAAPSFQSMIKRNQLVSARDSLIMGIKAARGEAIERKLPVSICASNNQSTCAGQWHDGWIIFVDIDSDGERAGGAEEPLIDVQHAYRGVTTGAGSGVSYINFVASGLKNPGGAIDIGFCDSNPASAIAGQSIVVAATGSASYSDATDAGC